jgi:hypothetical protein
VVSMDGVMANVLINPTIHSENRIIAQPESVVEKTDPGKADSRESCKHPASATRRSGGEYFCLYFREGPRWCRFVRKYFYGADLSNQYDIIFLCLCMFAITFVPDRFFLQFRL